MIIGTAGHIDHGKTTLVKALTGADTDRLKEEKARGISIELGYAYTPLPGGGVLGFIDVPGHERLVHTMVAGSTGIDLALLVIAADDGIMPQTREHLAILELLCIPRAVVALTKADRVAVQRRQAVAAAIGALLAPTAWAGAAVFPVNALLPQEPGVRALRAHLEAVATGAAARAATGPFRLAVDRVFTLTGRGTVVTGTVLAGEVRVGEDVQLMPQGRCVRVRSLHAQHREAQAGHAGERCALNLAGLETTEVRRGDFLATPGALAATTRLDVRLTLLPSAARLTPGAPLHIHLGTAHQVAQALLLETAELCAAQSARVQLVFRQAVCAVPGERFIARDAQAAQTAGGGVVIDPGPPARGRRSAARLAWLTALERLPQEGAGALLQQARHGLRLMDLVRLTGRPAAQGLPPQVRLLGPEPGPSCREDARFVLHADHREALRAQALAALGRFHAQAPDEPGADLGRLRRMAVPGLPEELWRLLMEELLTEGAVRRRGAWWLLPGHEVTLAAEDQALLTCLEPLLTAGGFDPPWVRQLAVQVQASEERVRSVLLRAARHGRVHQVVRDLFYGSGRVRELARVVRQIAHQDGGVSAARCRDALGVGRKRAIQILEFFDRVGFTRRIRDLHVLRPGCGWDPSQ